MEKKMGNVKINQVYKGGTHLLGLVKFDHFRLTKNLFTLIWFELHALVTNRRRK